MSRFIRAFCYGLSEGDTAVVVVNAASVQFTSETAQQDISIESDPIPVTDLATPVNTGNVPPAA